MLNIVLCDDNIKFCDKLRKQLEDELPNTYKIQTHYRLDEDLEKYIESNKNYTVYILDIDLKSEEIDGYCIAKKIRQVRNYNDEIIFLTNVKQISKKIISYKIQPIDFIDKSGYYLVDLLNAIKTGKNKIVAREEDNDTGVLPLYYNKALYNISYKYIIYIELLNDSRNMVIKMHPDYIKDEFYMVSSINFVMKKLDNRFFQISRNAIINKDYFSSCDINSRKIMLKYNHILTGSEQRIKELIKCMKQ